MVVILNKYSMKIIGYIYVKKTPLAKWAERVRRNQQRGKYK